MRECRAAKLGGKWGVMATAGVVVGGVMVAAAVVAGSAVFARAVATPASRPVTPLVIMRVGRIREIPAVWLRGQDAALPGQYSLLWKGGSARLGRVLEHGKGLVAREIVSVDAGQLREGVRSRITGWWYPSALALSEESADVRGAEEVDLPLNGGVAPAWVLRPTKRARLGRGGRWAIHVHGRGALPTETLRGVVPLARAGVTNLVMSYRNDPGAPSGEHGRYGFGLTEAQDVDSAVQYALEQGATRVTLVGWSMGATACLIAAARGAHRDRIDGLILDSPAVDWPGLLTHQARLNRAPDVFARLGMSFIERGVVATGAAAGIDLAQLTPETIAQELRVPTLIHASRGDTFVPSAGAERLANLRPELVHLRLVDRGEHVKLWNVEPQAWERVTEVFARALPQPAWRG